MLTCRELVQNLSSDFLDGGLSWRQRIGVRFHLLICAHCQRFMQQLNLVRRLVSLRPVSVPSEAEIRALAERLRHQLGLRQE